MNYSMVKRLILKDWYMQRWVTLGSLPVGAVTLGIIAIGGKAGFFVGLLLLVTVIIAVGGQLAVATMVSERKEQTLAFVMSLPISYREYTAAKIVGNLLIFLVPWITLVLGSFAILMFPPVLHLGLIPFVAVMATEILTSTCLIFAVALISESQGWTVGAIIVGNLTLNVFGYYVGHIPGIVKGMWGAALNWSSAASFLLLGEFVTIALLLTLTFFVQSRKRDFL